jgi:hypothetical protein
MLWAFTVNDEKTQLVCIETGALITNRDGQAHLEGPGSSAVGNLSMSFDALVEELRRRQVLVNLDLNARA